nr:flagellar filament capping protein FliD [uncultured Holophaga sp.]
MASAVSFSGLSTGLDTESIVNAIIEAASQPLVNLQKKKDKNTERETLLTSLRTQLNDLSSSITTLRNSSLQARTVTNSDTSNQYVSATATGTATGTYDVSVQQLATKAQLVSTNSVSDTSASLGGTAISGGDYDGMYKYSITDTNGVTKDFYLSEANNTLDGLKKAINTDTYSSTNTSGLAVSASIIQTAATGGSYKLVLSATDTGAGTASSTFTLTGNGSDTLGIGTAAQTSSTAKNAQFTVNGVSMERTSNTISDAVEGMTFTLRSQDSPTTTSTLTVSTDTSTITSAIQDLVDKFNAVYKTYKDNSGQGTPTTDASGNTVPGEAGVLAGDSSIRSIISNLRSAIMSMPSGLSGESTYSSAVELGLSTQTDGTLSLDKTKLQTALTADPNSVSQVFDLAGQATQSYINDVASPGSGNIARIITSIDYQNLNLAKQIQSMTDRLAAQRTSLESQYARLESVIGQMQAAQSSLSSISTSSSS